MIADVKYGKCDGGFVWSIIPQHLEIRHATHYMTDQVQQRSAITLT